jgi:hypothetical protein
MLVDPFMAAASWLCSTGAFAPMAASPVAVSPVDISPVAATYLAAAPMAVPPVAAVPFAVALPFSQIGEMEKAYSCFQYE